MRDFLRKLAFAATIGAALVALAGASMLLSCEVFAPVNDTPNTCRALFGFGSSQAAFPTPPGDKP